VTRTDFAEQLISDGCLDKLELSDKASISKGYANFLICAKKGNKKIKIIELWKKGLGFREIARTIGVAKSYVADTINKEKEKSERPISLIPTRCPGCGGMVFMPCIACHTENVRKNKAVRRPIAEPTNSHYTLDLNKENLSRYNEIAKKRERINASRNT